MAIPKEFYEAPLDVLLAHGNFLKANTSRMKASADKLAKDDLEPPAKIAKEGNNSLDESLNCFLNKTLNYTQKQNHISDFFVT